MKIKNYALTACCLISFAGYAQHFEGREAEALYPGATVVEFSNPTKAPSFIIFKNGVVSENNFFAETRSLFNMQFADTWKQYRSERDDIGMVHHRYQQYYNGIVVEHGEYILHEKNNSLTSANGVFYDGLNLPTNPLYTEAKALDIALSDVNALRYKWQMPGEEALLKEMEKNSKATYYPAGELVITTIQGEARKPVFSLAYKFDVYADQPMSRQYVYVDAITGRVVKKINRICEFIANGTLSTMYSGTKNLVTDSVSPGNYRLRDLSRGGNIETYDMNTGTDYGLAVDFTDADNIWNTTTNFDNAAYDAHYGAQMTYDYYLTVHSRNSYDNLGSAIRSYVHFFSGYNNAFWNGSVMSYGDGNGVNFSPLTTLDVCGHELTHGITEYSSNLVYANESGALNESFSDIFGTCVDFFANPGGANFLVGEQCYTPLVSGDALRSMSNPNSEGDPDTYFGTNWYTGTADNGGVHTNSGVQNFWFYLLCQGGTGTNDIGFSYNVAAIGIANARQIAYRNNSFYLTSASQYIDARTYSIQAAGDIFGPCSAQQLAVRNAWDAVGVTGPFNPHPWMTATNNAPMCPGGTLSLTSAAGGASYAWSGPAGFTSNVQNPSISNVASGQAGTYTVTVTDGNGCSGSKTTSVFLYPQPTVTATSSVTVCPGDSASLTSSGAAFGVGGAPVNFVSTTTLTVSDFDLAGDSSSLVVTNNGNANQLLSVTIDSMIISWVADLRIYLVAPNLSRIPLAIEVGGSGDNFLHTKFSSTALNVIGTPGNNSAPFTGIYAPQSSFSNLTGVANGTWKLKIVDAYSQDIATLYGWTLTLSGPNGVASYSWSPPTGLSNTAITNPKASPPATTTYHVTVTDLRGCTVSGTSTVNVNAIAPTHVTTDISCNGLINGVVDLTVNGGNSPYTYNWSNGITTQDISGLASGTYTVTVHDFLGCTKTHTASVIEPPVLSFNAAQSNPSCIGVNNGSVNLTVSGGVSPYGFAWSHGATTEDITGLGAGTYIVTITDAHGCVTNGGFILVAAPSATVNAITTNVSCHGLVNGALNVTVTGGNPPFNFNWSNGATTEDVSSLAAGNYQVTVTQSGGCTTTSSFSIIEPAAVSVSSTQTNPSCSNPVGLINITVNGGTPGYTYLWSTGATTEDVSSLPMGTYTITVTDLNGCTATKQTTLAGAIPFTITPTITNASCNGSTNGSIVLAISNGLPPFTYLWAGGSTTQNRSGLAAGDYTVTVTDNGGCTSMQAYTVTQPALLALTSVNTNISCRSTSTGSIDLSVAGGSPAYAYLWNNGSTLQDRSGLPIGTYTVTVTDGHGCTKTKSSTLTQPATILTVNSSKTNARCFGAPTGMASVSPAGSTPPYTYLWSTFPASTSASVTGLVAGVYNCLVTDNGGCTKNVSIIITEPPQLIPVVTQVNVSFPGGNDGSASVSASGGVGPYTYIWSTVPQTTTASVTGLSAGLYSIKVTDTKGCFVKINITITQPFSKGSGLQEQSDIILKAYPNPGSGLLHVDFESPDKEASIISLMDYTGRIVYHENVVPVQGLNHLEYDFSLLPRGIYFFILRSASRQSEIKIILH